MKPTIYLSAPVSGYEEQERRLFFRQWQNLFQDLGYETVNPLDNGLPFQAPWQEHMRADLSNLLTCQTIVFLSEKLSPGMAVEKEVAKATGIKIVWAEVVLIAKGNPERLEALLTP